MFDASVYETRRKALREEIGTGLVLLVGNSPVGMTYKDNAYPMIQDRNFLYYVGLEAPNLVCLMDVDSGEEWLVGAEQSTMEAVFMGQQPPLSEVAKQAGINQVLSFSALQEKLQKSTPTIHYLPTYRGDTQLTLAQLLGIDPLSLKPSSSLIQAIVKQREVKTAEEITLVKTTMETTAAMHGLAMKSTKAGRTEEEVLAEMINLAVSSQTRFSYQPIFSVDGHILHNNSYDNVMADGQLVLNDTGVHARNGYATDITRTFPVSGQFTPQQKQVYETVLSMQDTAFKAIKSGVTYQSCHLKAARTGLEGLQAMGLIKGDVSDALAEGAYGLFFPHGLGHLLGLDVHDMEGLGEDAVGYDASTIRAKQFGLSALRLGKSLRENMLITVEPGIYFIPMLIEKWRREKKLNDFICYEKLEAFMSFGGIRIEDNVRVTKDGLENLSEVIPKTVEAVEAACQ